MGAQFHYAIEKFAAEGSSTRKFGLIVLRHVNTNFRRARPGVLQLLGYTRMFAVFAEFMNIRNVILQVHFFQLTIN